MVRSISLGAPASEIVAFVYFCLIVIPAPLECDSVNKVIVDAAIGVHDLDVFQVTPTGEVEVKTELDLILSLNLFKGINTSPQNLKEKRGIRDVNLRWPKAVVYYEIDESGTSSEDFKNIVLSAINEYMKYSCLNFTQSKTAVNRIVFTSANGCWSYLGMKGGKQRLSLGPGCYTLPVALHEIGHALGFLHEHNRPDRDMYVKTTKYSLINSTFYNTFNVPYDYRSIMHYSGIHTIDASYYTIIGMFSGFSYKDIKKINVMYLCAIFNDCPLQNCPFNGFIFSKPFKGQSRCQCWCDSGDQDEPLVLCSNIAKEVAGPNLDTKDSTLDEYECKDVRDNCLTLKQHGVCLYELKMMMNLCPVTCNYCDKKENFCIDTEDSCSVLANSGACNELGLNATMQELCPQSCGLCPDTQSYCDIEKAFIKH